MSAILDSSDSADAVQPNADEETASGALSLPDCSDSDADADAPGFSWLASPPNTGRDLRASVLFFVIVSVCAFVPLLRLLCVTGATSDATGFCGG